MMKRISIILQASFGKEQALLHADLGFINFSVMRFIDEILIPLFL